MEGGGGGTSGGADEALPSGHISQTLLKRFRRRSLLFSWGGEGEGGALTFPPASAGFGGGALEQSGPKFRRRDESAGTADDQIISRAN